MKYVMNGALGRMGKSIINLAQHDDQMQLSGAVDVLSENTGKDIGELIGTGAVGIPLSTNLVDVINEADIVIDFSSVDATLHSAVVCAAAGKPLVTGITGMSAEQRDKFIGSVTSIPCVLAPNMSIGVNLLFKIVAEAASILGDAYDVEITEVHHRYKKDAPSGTARRLAEIVAESLNRDLEQNAVYGRNGMTGERTRTEIGIHASRIGDVIGEHTVSFGTIGERLELVHKVQSRDALSQGVIRAAKYLLTAEPGIYDMQDVLGFR